MAIPFLSKGSSKAGVVGLCFHPDRLALVHIEPGAAGSFAVKKCAEIAIRAQTKIGDELQKKVKELKLVGAKCVITLERQLYALHQIERPAVPDAEIVSAARWKVKELLGYPIDEAVLSAYEVPGTESRSKQDILYVVSARKARVGELVAAAESAGLVPIKVFIEDMALRTLATIGSGSIGSAALLHIADRSASVSIVSDKLLYVSRAIEFSRDELDFLDSGEEGGGIAGLANLGDDLNSRLALEVQRTLDYFDRQFTRPPVRELYVAGTRSIPQPVFAALESGLGLKTVKIAYSEMLKQADKSDEQSLTRCSLAAFGAIEEDLL